VMYKINGWLFLLNVWRFVCILAKNQKLN